MPRRNKPHARARDRTARALEMRLAGRSNGNIAAELGYASEAGARMAIDRELKRRTAAGVDTLRREHGQRLLSLLSACWDKATGGDTDAIRTAKQLLDSISRLYGLDATQRVALEGISSEQFGREAAELIEVIQGAYGAGSPAARAVAESVPGALDALPAAVRADLFTSPAAKVEEEDEDDEPWSNVGPESLCAAAIPASGTSQRVSAEDGRVSYPAPENDDQDADDAPDDPEPDIVEAEIVAEVIPLPPQPPSQRRVPASEVLDGFGVPLARNSFTRRLGGYDPLAHWHP